MVLAVYYRRAWRLAAAGELPWSSTDLALTVLPAAVVVAAALLLLAMVGVFAARARRADVRPGLLLIAGAATALAVVGAWPRADGPLLPSMWEAAGRAAAGIGAATLVVAAACLLGSLLLRTLPIRLDGWRERWLFRPAAGFLVLSYVSLALAAAGLYRPAIIKTMVAVVGAVGLVAGALALRRRHAADSRRASRPAAVAPAVGLAEWPWIGVIALALCLSLVGALAPEVEYDALWYHLWLPKLWIAAGRPVDLPNDFVALYPLTFELVFGAGLASGGAIAAKLLHWCCLPLLALAVFTFTRRNLPHASPWLAAAIVVSTPTVLWEATTAYVDLALALYVTLGLYALLRRRESPAHGWLAVAAGCFGLACAIKHLGLVVVALVAAGAFVSELRRERRFRGGAPAGRGDRSRRARPRFPVVSAGVARVGQPVLPGTLRCLRRASRRTVGRGGGTRPRAFKARFGFPRTPLSLVWLPWNVTMHGARFGGCIGPVFLIALPWMLRRPRRPATAWLTWLVVGYTAVWASPVSSFQMRFLVPIVPALAMLAASGVSYSLRVASAAAWRRLVTVSLMALLRGEPPAVHAAPRR